MNALSGLAVFEGFPIFSGGPSDSGNFLDVYFREPSLVRARVEGVAVDPHSSPFSLKMALAGEESYFFGRREVRVNPQTAMLTPEASVYGSLARGRCHSISLHFPAAMVSDAVSTVSGGLDLDRPGDDDALDFPVHSWSLDADAQNLVSRLASGSSDALEDIAFEMLMLAARRVADARGQMLRLPAKKKSVKREILRRLMLARAAIDEKPDTEWTLGQIARVALMSEFHLHRCFVAAFGVSPGQYVRTARMERAKQLLASSRIPVTQVAGEVGFENLSSFIRSFRLIVGVTPRDYRRLAA